MAFNFHITQFKEKRELPSWVGWAFYISVGIMGVILICYVIFSIKVYLQEKAVSELNKKIAVYGSQDQKAIEKQVMDFKKQLKDFSGVIANHKISSNVFAFIEQKTLPKIWFSSFDLSETTNDIRLSGTAESMEVLSQQVLAFEKSTDYVKHISIMDSQVDIAGKISFLISLSFDPNIFSYGNQ